MNLNSRLARNVLLGIRKLTLHRFADLASMAQDSRILVTAGRDLSEELVDACIEMMTRDHIPEPAAHGVAQREFHLRRLLP